MSDRADDEGSTEKAVAGGEDRISALPDDVLRHMLSLLQSSDSVQTCVLAKRWRTLWKSVPALRIVDEPRYDWIDGKMERTRTFVNELLHLRDPTPLEVCVIYSLYWDSDGYDYCSFEKAFQRIEPWLQYALSHKVRVLEVYANSLTTNLALASSRLERLELTYMKFEGSLDFSSCPVLDVLEMSSCGIPSNISSQSLQHLKIRDGLFDTDIRSRISAPNLISLELEGDGLTPLLDTMPSLVTASVNDVPPPVHYGEESCSVVLEGLSSATNLELRAPFYYQNSVFTMDLKWCPMFNKLKTLWLNDWCVFDDFTGLVYFLQHAPILEMLTLHLDRITKEEQHVIKTDESYNSSDQSFLSKHLKVVKIICDTKEDPRVHHILKILCTHGVRSEKIDIQ